MKKKILIVEDVEGISHFLNLVTNKHVKNCEISIVISLAEVRSLMEEGRKFDLTYWDGKLKDGFTIEEDLLERASRIFGGYHIAMSSDRNMREEQGRQGCGKLSLEKPNFDIGKIEQLLKSLFKD